MGRGGQRRVAMKDAQQYRMNAAECLSAAERCGPSYRRLTLAIAASWLSLARQEEAMDELLTIWSKAHSTTLAAPSPQSFRYPPDLHRLFLPAPARGRNSLSVQRGCDSPMPLSACT
jgi:hypothetical protein